MNWLGLPSENSASPLGLPGGSEVASTATEEPAEDEAEASAVEELVLVSVRLVFTILPMKKKSSSQHEIKPAMQMSGILPQT